MVSVFIVAASMKKGDEAAVVRCYSQKLSDLLYENFFYGYFYNGGNVTSLFMCVTPLCQDPSLQRVRSFCS
jgi:hypothetical protein